MFRLLSPLSASSAIIALCLAMPSFAQAPKTDGKKADTAKKSSAKAADKTADKAADKAAPPSTTPPTAATAAGATAGSSSSAPAAAGPAAAEYAKLMEDWKEIFKDLRKLKLQFQTAALADQARMQTEWEGLVARGNETATKIEAAGIKAYAESPNADPELTRFLVKLAADAIDRDDYASAKRITDALIEHNCPEKQIWDAAAIAAFVLNDYDNAEKSFKQAKDFNVLSTYGKELEASLKEYKDLWPKEKAIRDAEEKANDLPRVKLTTNKGVIVLELFENEAPETVGNFVSLVEQKIYDKLTFHRVLKNFMAQGGDPKGDGTGGPGYNIYCECHKPDYRRHFQGSLSMAHAGRDTGGSQFFITFRQTPNLNGKHTCFGRVIEGMDVLSKIQRRDPQAASPPAPDAIITAEVVRKRDHVYQPHKVE